MLAERPEYRSPHDKLVELLRDHSLRELQQRIRDPEIKAEMAKYVARRAITGRPNAHVASQVVTVLSQG
jgi:hypothetical protein